MVDKSEDSTWLMAVGAIALGSMAAVAYLVRLTNKRQVIETVDPDTLILDMPSNAGHTAQLIQIDGAINFRDIGGYYTIDGKHRVRQGQIYRSGALTGLTPHGAEQLADMGIQFVCDLRTDDEVARKPDQIPADTGIRYLHNPVAQDNPMRVLKAILFQKKQLGRLFAEAYKYDLIEQGAEFIGDAIRHLSDPQNRPAVLHCTAGKDRAGVLTALILGLLDVPEDVILADYTQSNRHYEDFAALTREDIQKVRHLGVREEHLQPAILADATVLKEALDFIRTEYGSLRGYLVGPAGLDESVIESLRDQLLEPTQ